MKKFLIAGALLVALAVGSSHAGPVYAQNKASAALPSEFHGLWVKDAERECPDLKRDEDAFGMGESALLLRADKMYSQESLCKITGHVVNNCCGDDGERTVAANYSCGGHTQRVILSLKRFESGVMLVEIYENSASGPVVGIYSRKCR